MAALKSLDLDISRRCKKEWDMFLADFSRISDWKRNYNQDPYASAMLGILPPDRAWVGQKIIPAKIVSDKKYPGPSGWNPKRLDITRISVFTCRPEEIIDIPGRENEHELFMASPFGRMTQSEFDSLSESLKIGWVNRKTILIFCEDDGKVFIAEGNHRLRAAMANGIECLVELRWFGKSGLNPD